jgi:membrane protease YdiL (CAAX protease family)
VTETVVAPRAAITVAIGGCLLLVARPVLVAGAPHPAALLVALFVALFVVGAGWPFAPAAAPGTGVAGVLAVGVAAFAAGRLIGGGHAPTTAVGVAVAANSLAAVAEEAFFRRFLYGLLEPYGSAVAVVGSAVVFALVHVTVYGVWVLPIDLAAGAILSWQRWATGSWKVPAATHVVANLLVVL